jgi:hypothetical protein
MKLWFSFTGLRTVHRIQQEMGAKDCFVSPSKSKAKLHPVSKLCTSEERTVHDR